MISEEAKATIDALSRDDLRLEVEKGNRSRFQRDNYAYARSRLAQMDEAEANRHVDRGHALMDEANNIARDANKIAVEANTRSIMANKIAVGSLVVAIISALISIVIWRSGAS